jgi:hypothetical protein
MLDRYTTGAFPEMLPSPKEKNICFTNVLKEHIAHHGLTHKEHRN